MPQVDLETLVTACTLGGSDRKIVCETKLQDDGGSDRKIACETKLENDDDPTIENSAFSGDCAADDIPPGSFWLSKDAEYDWFEHHAYCYERDDSTKGNNYISNSKNPNAHHGNPSSNSNSQRFSVNLKSKGPIIGLPHNIQKTTFVDSKRRIMCNKPPANLRLFPKRSGSSGKSVNAQLAEPGSPKVSCMGRVRSKRCKRRSNSVKRTGDKKPTKDKKAGFCSRVLDIFRSNKGHRYKKTSRSGSRKSVQDTWTEEKAEPMRRSVSVRRVVVCEPVAETEPPGLGGMKRFASGRRSCSSLTGEEAN